MDINKTFAKRSGLQLGIFLVIYGLIYRYAELDRVSILGWIFYLAIPVSMFLWYRSTEKTALTFKSAFKLTALLAIIGNGIYTLFVYVFNKFIDDSLLQKSYAQGMERIEEQGLTGESLELAKKQIELLTTAELFSVVILFQLMIFSLVCGVVYGVVANRQRR